MLHQLGVGQLLFHPKNPFKTTALPVIVDALQNVEIHITDNFLGIQRYALNFLLQHLAPLLACIVLDCP